MDDRVSDVRPAARGYVGPGAIDPAYLPARMPGVRDPADVPSRTTARLMQQHAAEQQLAAILGAPVYVDTNYFPTIGGGSLKECYYQGQKLMFSLWSPHKRTLIDIFTRLPEPDEMAARERFAEQNDVRYFVTPPGYTLSIDDLREALSRAPEEASHV